MIIGDGDGAAAASRLMTFVLRERKMVGAYGAEPEEVRDVVRMLAEGRLTLPRVIGDVIALDDVRRGVERVARGDTGGSRIVVDLAA